MDKCPDQAAKWPTCLVCYKCKCKTGYCINRCRCDSKAIHHYLYERCHKCGYDPSEISVPSRSKVEDILERLAAISIDSNVTDICLLHEASSAIKGLWQARDKTAEDALKIIRKRSDIRGLERFEDQERADYDLVAFEKEFLARIFAPGGEELLKQRAKERDDRKLNATMKSI